jgi:hypothetical protein
MAASSGHGTGKAQPVSLELHTPRGLRRWGALQVGDEVFGGDGRPTRIVAVHDRGERDVYRVAFDDGASTRCCADHLWRVRGRNERRRGLPWRDVTTAGLVDAGLTRPNGVGRARQWEIPRQGVCEFPRQTWTVAPYVLGVWLGNGCRKTSRITTADDDVVRRIAAYGESIHQVRGNYAWGIDGLRVRLRALGVLDCYSYQKAVPPAYLEAPSEDRAELLRGLLDTDGECSPEGCVGFSSTSRALADDVVWLARSLGGKAQIQPTVKHPKFPDAQGQPKDGRPCWRATVQMPAGFRCFHTARKQARVLASVEDRYLSRWIDTITPDGREDCRCLTVADPLGLYLTNDFIVTHNSSLGGMLAAFLLSTRPDSIGTVTAGTNTQLTERTWAAIRAWLAMCLTKHWFHAQATGIYSVWRPATWKLIPQTCKPENAQSFAGQHAKTSTSWYLFDEASEVDDRIWQTADPGGLTDGEPMFFAWGQLVRNTGMFYRICQGDAAARWNHRRIDSRTSRFTNKALLAQIAEDYGEESDTWRVRVLGLPPRASELQYIDTLRVQAARRRSFKASDDEPLVAGFDVSGGGKAWNVIRFRRGLDGNAKPPIRIPGEHDADRSQRIGLCAELLADRRPGHQLAAMFVDSAFGSPIVVRLQALGFDNVYEANFGGASPDSHQANLRAFMYAKAKEWLLLGTLPDDDALCEQLCLPGYHFDRRNRLLIESKAALAARGEKSPDDADAFVLTWAQAVAAPRPAYESKRAARPVASTWG